MYLRCGPSYSTMSASHPSSLLPLPLSTMSSSSMASSPDLQNVNWSTFRNCCWRLITSPWWSALIVVLVLTVDALGDLLIGGASNLHLRAATLRAAGGSARLGARGMCMLRVSEAAIVWIVLILLRRGCNRRAPPRPGWLPSTLVASSSCPAADGDVPKNLAHRPLSGQHGTGPGGVSGAIGSSSCGLSLFSPVAVPGGTNSAVSDTGSGIGSVNAHGASAAYSPVCASPPNQTDWWMRQSHHAGATLLCTLSGWVWVLLGCFTALGSICSFLVAMGGRTAPGMLGEMVPARPRPYPTPLHLTTPGRSQGGRKPFARLPCLCATDSQFNHDGPLGRRSVLGRSLPALTWLCFEIGSAGALYVAGLEIAMLMPQMLQLLCPQPPWLAVKLQALSRLMASGGAEPPLIHKLRSVSLHALALIIAFTELCLNDLPILPQHRPLALLMGCAFSLNLLTWHAYRGRFTYLYADAPRTSAPAALLAGVCTPVALVCAFACLCSLSASQRVRPL